MTDILNAAGADDARGKANATFDSSQVALSRLDVGKQHGEGGSVDGVFVAPNHGGGHRNFKDFNTGNSATSIANWVSKTNSFKILKQKPKVKGQFLSPLRNRLKIDDSCADNRVKDAMQDPA